MPERADAGFGVGLLRGIGKALLRIPPSLSWVPCVLWAGLIWWLSSQPVLDASRFVPRSPLFGNLAHAFEFGMLALWTVLLLPRRAGWPDLGPGPALGSTLCVGAYAFVDEWHQSLVPLRNASVFDLITDVVGILSVLWVIAYLGRPGATERGLGLRLLACLLASLVAAWCATAYGRAYGPGPWPQ